MPRKPSELGIKSPFRFRHGTNFDKIRGVNKESDPGAIRDDELQSGINIRITASGKVVPRGGQTKLNTTALDGAVMAIFDDEDPTDVLGSRVYWGLTGPGTTLATYHPDQSPALQQVSITGETTTGILVGVHDSKLWIAVDSGGVDTVFKTLAVGGTTLTTVFTASGIAYTDWIGGISYDDDLYLYRTGASSVPMIYKWDGASLTLDDNVGVGVATGSDSTSFALHDNDLYYVTAAFGGGTGRVRKKSGGVWSTEATHSESAAARIVSYSNSLWVFGAAGPIWEVTGGGLTLVNTIAGTTADSPRFAEFDGYLYYLWPVFGAGSCNLGRFNGSAWTDSYDVAPFPFSGIIRPVITSQGMNLVGVTDNGGTYEFYKSNGTDATSWSQVSAAFTLPGPSSMYTL